MIIARNISPTQHHSVLPNEQPRNSEKKAVEHRNGATAAKLGEFAAERAHIQYAQRTDPNRRTALQKCFDSDDKREEFGRRRLATHRI